MTDQQPGLKQEAKGYPFVDWIRMISMIGIIWAHTPNFEGTKSYNSLDDITLYFFFMNFFKFGVICFFLISGFLLAGKIQQEPAISYFKRRVSGTLFAYLFAFALIVLLFIFKTNILKQPSSYSIKDYIVMMFLDSALWFLPNYWLSLLVIVSLKKWLNKTILGMLLLFITAVYTYQFVYGTHPQPHTDALFGFVFYLWLGYFIGKNKIHLRFQQINPYLLLGITVALFLLSGWESAMLYRQGNPEPMNILRISNQLYSLAAFAAMVSLFRKPFNMHFFKPRQETFGIYLYHMFALVVLTFVLKLLTRMGIFPYSDHTITFIGWFILKFIFVYVLTTLIVKVLIRYNIGFLSNKGS
jgi:peptidoglycan/LPS O-acetylase OafA/YrhL